MQKIIDIKITKNQTQIYQLFADGYSPSEIAKKLGKKGENVKATMFYVKKKYNFTTRVNAACELIRKGLID